MAKQDKTPEQDVPVGQEQEAPDEAPIAPDSTQAAEELLEQLDPANTTLRKLLNARDAATKSPRRLSARDFAPVELALPTGATVAVRPVDLKALALSGVIPNPLREAAWRISVDRDDTLRPTEEEKAEKTPAEVRHMEMEADDLYRRAVEALVMAVVTEPKLVAMPEDEDTNPDAIWVGRLHPIEKEYIILYVQAPAVAYSAFRTE